MVNGKKLQFLFGGESMYVEGSNATPIKQF